MSLKQQKKELASLIRKMLLGDIKPEYILNIWHKQLLSDVRDYDIDIIIHQLEHYANDIDIRSKDQNYEKFFRAQFKIYIQALRSCVQLPIFLYDSKLHMFDNSIDVYEYLYRSKMKIDNIVGCDVNGVNILPMLENDDTINLQYLRNDLGIPVLFRRELESRARQSQKAKIFHLFSIKKRNLKKIIYKKLSTKDLIAIILK